MRRVLWLAFAALLAGAGLYASSGAGPTAAPSAEIAGAPLDPAARAQETAAFESLATAAPASAEARTGPLPAPPVALKPVAQLALDLDHRERVGDHFEANTNDGRRAKLTLDPDLQDFAEKLLDESRAPRGAIVAMTPDGKILALAGRRTDEPKGGSQGTFDAGLALESWAPAASVFKLVTASALVAGGTDGDTNVCYHGGIRSVTESNLRDDKRDNVCQTLTFGVAHSNNALVGKLAFQHLDPPALAKMANDLGLASPPHDALALHGPLGELSLPETHDLAFAKAAAGFDGSKLSALGGAMLAATFADGGEQPSPRIVESLAGDPAHSGASRRVIPENVAHEVAKMMAATCDYGTASRAFGRHQKINVAGKTGSLTRTDPFYMEHSWFVGYAPADKPEIVVAVVFGNPESWHLKATEAARRMIDHATRRDSAHDSAQPAHGKSH